MNNIQNLENIGGNLITNQYYKFVGENMLNLGSEDYDILITNSNIINICFPMGLFGIVSPVYGFTKNDRIDLRTIINIINEYYNGVITEQERKQYVRHYTSLSPGIISTICNTEYLLAGSVLNTCSSSFFCVSSLLQPS